MVEHKRLFIGGEWVEPSTDAVIEVVSPHSEQVIGTVAAAGPADADLAITRARTALEDGTWARTDPAERAAAVTKLAALYKERRREMAQLISDEMGAPITFSKFSQATMPMLLLGAYADLAGTHNWEERRPGR